MNNMGLNQYNYTTVDGEFFSSTISDCLLGSGRVLSTFTICNIIANLNDH